MNKEAPLGVLSNKWGDKAERHRKSRCSREVLLEDFSIIEDETEQAVIKKIEAMLRESFSEMNVILSDYVKGAPVSQECFDLIFEKLFKKLRSGGG